MKCVTIKSGNEYIADVPMVVVSDFYGNGIMVKRVNDVDEAKHYRSMAAPKAWLKKTTAGMIEKLEVVKKELVECSRSNTMYNIQWKTQRLSQQVPHYEQTVKWFENAQVIEIDVERPNFLDKDHKIRFDDWRTNRGTAGKSSLSLEVSNTSRHCCKSCGIKLKNIPYYTLQEGNPLRICIPCLYIRMDKIKTAFEAMPEDFRTNIVNELICASI